MRIVYQSGKLYLSLCEEEKKDIVESYPKPCEIDLSLIPVLSKDLSNINE